MKTNRRVRYAVGALSFLLICCFGTIYASVGPTGGTVFTILIDPTDSDRLYVGTYNGGVYRSTNGR